MSSLIKIIFSIFLIYYPINSYSNDDKKITISHLIQSAELTLKKISKNDDIKNFKNYLKNCRAILIFPEVYEGGFFFGAKGGNGVLLIRKSKDTFSGPFFYSIGGLSVGLQFGAKSGKVVMTIMTNRGLKSVLKERVKFGVDVDAVVISDGVGYSVESTLRLADIYSFTDNSGLFLGSSIEGSYLQPRNDLNRRLYKTDLDSDDILNYKNPKKEISNILKIIDNLTDEDSNKQQ
ncbi:MAG: lipid-binding SYLF domain-containing protein [Pseudomonadota bacterium]|nr:lipid-binding SYLF domain-containing protein [Pseudomonadota bacterium]